MWRNSNKSINHKILTVNSSFPQEYGVPLTRDPGPGCAYSGQGWAPNTEMGAALGNPESVCLRVKEILKCQQSDQQAKILNSQHVYEC